MVRKSCHVEECFGEGIPKRRVLEYKWEVAAANTGQLLRDWKRAYLTMQRRGR
ncbi:MAG: hypothetical protein HFH72_03735 [Lachnospiraceae bacterium]|nr:hypothetical protein [Lachnospiraceae bacterium]